MDRWFLTVNTPKKEQKNKAFALTIKFNQTPNSAIVSNTNNQILLTVKTQHCISNFEQAHFFLLVTRSLKVLLWHGNSWQIGDPICKYSGNREMKLNCLIDLYTRTI